MTRNLLTIFAFSFLVQMSGQTNKIKYEQKIDTLNIHSDSVFVKLRDYADNKLTEELTAYLFIDTLIIPRYKYFRNIFKTKVPATRVLKHGLDICYLDDGNRKIRNFKYQHLVDIKYYDKRNKEINVADLRSTNVICGPNEDAQTYIFTGTKKKK